MPLYDVTLFVNRIVVLEDDSERTPSDNPMPIVVPAAMAYGNSVYATMKIVPLDISFYTACLRKFEKLSKEISTSMYVVFPVKMELHTKDLCCIRAEHYIKWMKNEITDDVYDVLIDSCTMPQVLSKINELFCLGDNHVSET